MSNLSDSLETPAHHGVSIDDTQEANRGRAPEVSLSYRDTLSRSKFVFRHRLISVPRVDIYVGKDKKHYSVPKGLLCYYSTYFDRCFNGKFKETKEGKLELLDDQTDNFELLLEYFLHGTVPLGDVKPRSEKGSKLDLVGRYMELLEYADKYNMQHCIAEVLFAPLKDELIKKSDRQNNGLYHVRTGCVELIFRVTGKGDKLRTLITQAVLSQQGINGITFEKQEEDIPDFAQEMLKQIWASISAHGPEYCYWRNPLTLKGRKV